MRKFIAYVWPEDDGPTEGWFLIVKARSEDEAIKMVEADTIEHGYTSDEFCFNVVSMELLPELGLDR